MKHIIEKILTLDWIGKDGTMSKDRLRFYTLSISLIMMMSLVGLILSITSFVE